MATSFESAPSRASLENGQLTETSKASLDKGHSTEPFEAALEKCRSSESPRVSLDKGQSLPCRMLDTDISESFLQCLVDPDCIAAPASPGQDGNSRRSSFWESESDLGSEDMPPAREWHNDHWDRIVYRNIWESDANDWRWQNSWIEEGRRSKTNSEFAQEQETQDWLKKLPLVRRDNLHTQLDHWGEGTLPTIPLFQGENGDEYQLSLAIGGSAGLPQVFCPTLLENIGNCAKYHFQLKARITDTQKLTTLSVAIPKFAMSLGFLKIRTRARPDMFKGRTFTEHTDYSIIVDFGSNDMRLWIVAPRQQLQARTLGIDFAPKLPELPIFNSLMMISDDDCYDIACIMPSIHHLGDQKADTNGLAFQETCKLVRKTRAKIDPICLVPQWKHVEEFLSQELVSEPAPTSAHFRRLREGLAKMWAAWTGSIR